MIPFKLKIVFVIEAILAAVAMFLVMLNCGIQSDLIRIWMVVIVGGEGWALWLLMSDRKDMEGLRFLLTFGETNIGSELRKKVGYTMSDYAHEEPTRADNSYAGVSISDIDFHGTDLGDLLDSLGKRSVTMSKIEQSQSITGAFTYIGEVDCIPDMRDVRFGVAIFGIAYVTGSLNPALSTWTYKVRVYSTRGTRLTANFLLTEKQVEDLLTPSPMQAAYNTGMTKLHRN